MIIEDKLLEDNMEIKMEKNGLKLFTIVSSAFPLEALQKDPTACAKKNFNGDGFAVAYMDYGVLIGRYGDNGFVFCEGQLLEAEFLQRLRIFNQQEELLLWRVDGGFEGRRRIDNDSGYEVDVVEAQQVLFGTTAQPLINGDAHFTELTERRGTLLKLPFKNLTVDNKDARIFIKTRNYIQYNDAHQAGYCDCRFLCFTDGKKCLI
jgi:CRISPR-associated protein (TIGR03984 family)